MQEHLSSNSGEIMKRTLLILCLAIPAGASQAVEMPPQAKALGCPACHAIDHKVVGPAWMDVSRRYRDKRTDSKFFDQLVKKVSLGGSGNWGSVPMVANDPVGTKHDKIVYMVKFILALSDQLPQYRNK
jgi:cytochrome c